MTQPTNNFDLLHEYIRDAHGEYTREEHIEILKEIQSRLIEPMEYEIGKEYEFSRDGDNWIPDKFLGYASVKTCTKYIRPIQVPDEVSSAITLLEQEGYIVTKK